MYDADITTAAPKALGFIDLRHQDASFRDALLAGLSLPQKSIPCRFLYDRRGSLLFDRICEQPEYYLTRTETGILRDRAADIAATVGPGCSLIELGSGSSIKTRILLDALPKPAEYMPIDVSAEHLREAAGEIARDYPLLDVTAICANYMVDWDLPETTGRPIGFFPGSTIGNLSASEACALLSAWRRRLAPHGLMIVGVDLVKSKGELERAYDDPAGVTQKFIRNILVRANRELGADFDPHAFDYEAKWSQPHSRIEMHLRSRRAQKVAVGERIFLLDEDERIHVENSHKYTQDSFRALAEAAGFTGNHCLTDRAQRFSIWLLGI